MLQRFETFMTGITTCYKHIQKIKAAVMIEFGLKGIHVMCLFFLHRYENELTAADLCRLCAEDKAAISRGLALLQEKGLIKSEEKTYRAKWMLTEEGLRVANRVDEMVEQWVAIGGEGLTEEERTNFYKTLSIIADNLHDQSNVSTD